jgi:hypothetical protein
VACRVANVVFSGCFVGSVLRVAHRFAQRSRGPLAEARRPDRGALLSAGKLATRFRRTNGLAARTCSNVCSASARMFTCSGTSTRTADSGIGTGRASQTSPPGKEPVVRRSSNSTKAALLAWSSRPHASEKSGPLRRRTGDSPRRTLPGSARRNRCGPAREHARVDARPRGFES